MRRGRIERTLKINEEAKRTVGDVNTRDKFLTGIALYAAEGNKSDGKAGFSNADPKLIKFMMDWFIRFAKVPIEKMRGAIWLHERLSEKRAKKFWSDLINLPSNQFNKTYVAKVKSDSKKKGKYPQVRSFTNPI